VRSVSEFGKTNDEPLSLVLAPMKRAYHACFHGFWLDYALLQPCPSLPCAVERRFSVAGANPAQHLSLRLVAALAHYGGNEMI